MARRDDQGRHERANRGPDVGAQDQEQEQDVELEQPKPEHSRLQDQMGNAAIAAMLGGGAVSGGVGIEIERESAPKKLEPEKDAPELGGDDDPVDADGPLIVEDLTHGWQPGTKKSDDRPAFTEPMPDDVLPPEDEPFLAALPSVPVPQRLPATSALDSLVQPSVDAVRFGLRDWALASMRWAPSTPTWRVLALLIARGIPVIQDPHGRVGVSRSRLAAIGVSGILAGPALAAAPSAANAALIDFVCELEGRAHAVRMVAAMHANVDPNKLPLARDLFIAHVPLATGRVTPTQPSGAATLMLRQAMDRLAALEDPAVLVPALTLQDAEPEDDDPLGLDAVLQEFTGGDTREGSAATDLVVASAERMAAACAATRVRFAGLCLAIAETSLEWSSGAPTRELDAQLVSLDEQVHANLQLLVEVARAAQRREVGLEGLGNGLKRAARTIARIRRQAMSGLIEIVGGIVPRDSLAGSVSPTVPGDLEEAFAVGEPRRAASWAANLADPRDRATCTLLVSLSEPQDPAATAAALEPLCAAWRADDPHLARALDVIRGSALLHAGDTDGARAIAGSLREVGLARHNGVLYAEGALLAMEAWLADDDLASADDLRHRAGAITWRMGAQGPLSLIARWQLPDEEKDG